MSPSSFLIGLSDTETGSWTDSGADSLDRLTPSTVQRLANI